MPRWFASRRPITDLPAPISPTSTMLRARPWPAARLGNGAVWPDGRPASAVLRVMVPDASTGRLFTAKGGECARSSYIAFLAIVVLGAAGVLLLGAFPPHPNALPVAHTPCQTTGSVRTEAVDRHAEAFLEMLAAERGSARNTLAAYAADLADFAGFAARVGA